MKVELKHIVGYLPYGLKMQRFDDHIVNITELIYSLPCALLTNFKPILHPLSDLTKEFEVNGEKFVPKEWLNVNLHNTPNFHHLFSEPHIWKYYQNNILKSNVEYCIIEKLYEWHFDIHSLIDDGLAIDINDLKS